MDFLIKGAQVADGSGGALFQANIGISDDKIAYIGNDCPEADRLIDAAGLVAAPGFIDMHSHSDYTLPIYPDAESAVGQGITTMVAGNCGMSPILCRKLYLPFCVEEAAMAKVLPEPIGGVNPGFMQVVPPELLAPAYEACFGTPLDWRDFTGYAEHLTKEKIAPNLISMVGHGAVRLQVLGPDCDRAATPGEISEICALCEEMLEQGAAGISFGLDYEPGMYASDEELEAVAACVAKKGKLLTVHYQLRPGRKNGSTHTSLAGMKEMLELAQKTGVHLQLSHLAGGNCKNPGNLQAETEAAREVLALVEEYRSRGARVTYDTLCSYTGGDFYYPEIAQRFLPYVLQAGGMQEFSAALRTGNYKKRILEDICAGKHASSGVMTRLDPTVMPRWGEGMKITRCSRQDYVGKTIGELTRMTGKSYVALLLDILAEDPEACYCMWRSTGPDTETKTFLQAPDMAVGLDVSSVDYTLKGLFADGRPVNRRSTGTYCGIIKYLTGGLMPLQELIRHLTAVPADILGLTDRGRLQVGSYADITLLDPARIASNEDFLRPNQRPSGVELVLINGKIALEGGAQTHIRSGKVLKR